MADRDPSREPAAGVPPPLHELAQQLSRLTPSTASPALEQLDALARVLGAVRDLVTENEGLAEEVLRSYEQLNLVFDFTRRIARLTDAAAIRAGLINRIAELLDASDLWMIEHDGGVEHFTGGSAADDERKREPRLARADRAQLPVAAECLNRFRERSGVFVHDDGRQHLLVAVLEGLDDRRGVLLARRRPGAPPFVSGELLLVESLASLGVQLLNNAELHSRLRRMSVETTRALVAAIDKKDHYTCGHSERVGLLARMTGEQLGLPEHELQTLEWAGLLHDVGKIGVPEEVLTKPGKLNDEEWAWIRKHPTMGYEILKPIASFTGVLDAVLYHHENPDGSGYPHGLKGEQIPLFARIVHVVDVFDALSSDRSYRPAFTLQQTVDILTKEAGTKLDRECVQAFLAALDALRTHDPERLAELFPQASRSDLPAAGAPVEAEQGRSKDGVGGRAGKAQADRTTTQQES